MARPRSYNETDVLEAATQVFWAKGYEGTSTRDLSACTGLTASSIYAAFGDKRELFHRALDHYLATTLRERMARYEAVDSPSAGIRDFFADVIERSGGDPGRRGCMMVNSVLEASAADARVGEAIAAELGAIESFLERRLTDARARGEIAARVSPAAAAKHLLTLLMGIRVLARVPRDPAFLAEAVDQGLASVGIRF
jgi:TetR/AcrR family transcriptional repressor of nem operon